MDKRKHSGSGRGETGMSLSAKAEGPHAWWGVLFIVGGVFALFLCLLSLLSGIPISSQDVTATRFWYFAVLVPVTVPVTFVAVYLHWLSMKMYKHA